MAEQRLHSALAPIDVLTSSELRLLLKERDEHAIRTRYRGVDVARFPQVIGAGNAGTLNLFAPANETPCGPESGYVWMIRRILVASSNPSDAQTVVLYRGNSPSDTANAYTVRQTLEQFQVVGKAYYPGNKALFLYSGEQIYAQVLTSSATSTYILTGEAIQVPAEMKGKVLS